MTNSHRNWRNFAPVVSVGCYSELTQGFGVNAFHSRFHPGLFLLGFSQSQQKGLGSMLSIDYSIPGVCEFKAFSSFFWRRTKHGNSNEVWRRRGFGWDWVNHHRRRSQTILANSTRATGNTGEPAKSSSNYPLNWDPFEDLFGLGVDVGSRKDSSKQEPQLKYELEMPCPTCEGRGYLFCPRCKFRKTEAACPLCSGRGYHDCPQCHGSVVWDDYLNESAWESLHSRSPLQTAEDDAIENMAITATPKRKTRRVYGRPLPETREKISRALKVIALLGQRDRQKNACDLSTKADFVDLEARTGSMSRRMKTIYQDPTLHAQRTAAIKKARGTDEARKLTSARLKEYFKSPENRLKHSQSMRGVRFTCTACGEEGHRRHFCPKLGFKSKKTETSRRYTCSFCGQNGHGCRRCPERQKLASSSLVTMTNSDLKDRTLNPKSRVYRCGVCHALGHRKNTCPTLKPSKRHCRICGQAGHNSQTCSAPAANHEN